MIIFPCGTGYAAIVRFISVRARQYAHATYYVPGEKFLAISRIPDNGGNLPDNGGNLPDNGGNLPDNGGNLPDNAMDLQGNEQIQAILAGLKKRMAYEDFAQIICDLCALKPMSKKTLCSLVGRNENYLGEILKRMIKDNILRHSENTPNNPEQAYIANEKENFNE